MESGNGHLPVQAIRNFQKRTIHADQITAVFFIRTRYLFRLVIIFNLDAGC